MIPLQTAYKIFSFAEKVLNTDIYPESLRDLSFQMATIFILINLSKLKINLEASQTGKNMIIYITYSIYKVV